MNMPFDPYSTREQFQQFSTVNPTPPQIPAHLGQPGAPVKHTGSAPHMPMPGTHAGAGGYPMNSTAASPGGMQRYREMTIDEMLLENRVIFLIGEINYSSATGVIMRLLYLQSQKKGVDISLYINSHGGSVDDTLAIYDTMRFLDCEIATYCIGRAQSGGAVILAAGTKGKRFILPHARVMIHQPYGGVGGQASDVQIQAEEILRAKRQINEILASHSGKSLEQIEEDSERDRYFSADQAKDYGLVDSVLENPTDKANAEKAAKDKDKSKDKK